VKVKDFMAKFTREIPFRVEKWACLILSDLDMDSELAYQVIQLSGEVKGVKFINNKRPTNIQVEIAFTEKRPYIRSEDSIFGYLTKPEENNMSADIGVRKNFYPELKEFLVNSSKVPELYVLIILTIDTDDLEGLNTYELDRWPDDVERLRIVNFGYRLIYKQAPF
jgi:hypothetical protein